MLYTEDESGWNVDFNGNYFCHGCDIQSLCIEKHCKACVINLSEYEDDMGWNVDYGGNQFCFGCKIRSIYIEDHCTVCNDSVVKF